MRYLVNFHDEYNAISESGEYDTLDEVEAAIKSAVLEGEFSIPHIQVYELVNFSVSVMVNF